MTTNQVRRDLSIAYGNEDGVTTLEVQTPLEFAKRISLRRSKRDSDDEDAGIDFDFEAEAADEDLMQFGIRFDSIITLMRTKNLQARLVSKINSQRLPFLNHDADFTLDVSLEGETNSAEVKIKLNDREDTVQLEITPKMPKIDGSLTWISGEDIRAQVGLEAEMSDYLRIFWVTPGTEDSPDLLTIDLRDRDNLQVKTGRLLIGRPAELTLTREKTANTQRYRGEITYDGSLIVIVEQGKINDASGMKTVFLDVVPPLDTNCALVAGSDTAASPVQWLWNMCHSQRSLWEHASPRKESSTGSPKTGRART